MRERVCLASVEDGSSLDGLQAPEAVIEKVDVLNGNSSVDFSTRKS